MENSRNIYNQDVDSEESDKTLNKSSEKSKAKKEPIKLEGILFNRSEEASIAKPEQKLDLPKTELETDREIAQEIVDERQDEIIEEIASPTTSADQELVAEADQQLLDSINEKLETTESVEQTVDQAYQKVAIEIQDKSPAIDEARQAMEEAYQGYWAPDYGIKPVVQETPAPTLEVQNTKTPPKLEEPYEYSYKPSVLESFVANIKDFSLPKIQVPKLEKQARKLRSLITTREAQIRDLQRNKISEQEPVEFDNTIEIPSRPEEQKLETMTMSIPEKPKAEDPKIEAKRTTDHQENLTKEQLIRLAEAIKIDGVTVRSMFEVGRFNETSLRRIVREYLRNGNLSKVVFEEIERHDKSRYAKFETLNQAKPQFASASITDYGNLPEPVDDTHFKTSPKLAKPQPTVKVSRPIANKMTVYSEGSGIAEKIVLLLGIGFMFIALVMLFVTILSHN